MGIYSGKLVQAGDAREVKPDPQGDIIVFPYVENQIEVAAKYRGKPNTDGSKRMWQKTGAKRTFFNADDIAPRA